MKQGGEVKKDIGWFKGLSRVARVSVLSSIALGGLFMTAAMIPPPSKMININPASAPAETKKPIITTETRTERQRLEFSKTIIDDASLAKGTIVTQTAGVDGVKTLTHLITFTDGIQVEDVVTKEITVQPVTEVTVIGTYVAPTIALNVSSSCDPNYSGCVPIASDVDCGGGGGNGPSYLYSIVSVIGADIYGLDHDGDGLACE